MRPASSLACVLAAIWVQTGTDPETGPNRHRVTLVDRQVSQHNSRWIVRYQVRHEGAGPLELAAGDVSVAYDGWVANSRLKPHSVSRRSQVEFALGTGNAGLATVIASSNDRQRCRERIALAISTGDQPAADPPFNKPQTPIKVESGQLLWLYLSIEHDHFLHGTYDPLLGDRDVQIRLGPCRLVDTVPLVAEQAPATPTVKLSMPPKERLDSRQYHSAPDSLYLAADVPGYQYFRFDDMPVRHGTRFKISFWYLVAVGTEGSCHVRMMEYQDTPNAWYRLEGGFDDQLTVQGRWQRFEQTFRALGDTTTMALDFRIVGANVGEMWIDDIELVPLYADAGGR
jgi:hypothetical protein